MTLYEKEIKAHALMVPDLECCGLLVLEEGKKYPVVARSENLATDPLHYFVVDPKLIRQHEKNIVGFYHSHVTERGCVFSDADKAVSEDAKLPCWLYSVTTDEFATYVPNNYSVPLVGRRFVLGVFDCSTLVRDYYRQILGIKLPYVFNDLTQVLHGREDLDSLIRQQCFQVKGTYNKHDVLVFALSGSQPNHVAVYEGDGVMLHQQMNSLSDRQTLSGYWTARLVKILRHQTLC